MCLLFATLVSFQAEPIRDERSIKHFLFAAESRGCNLFIFTCIWLPHFQSSVSLISKIDLLYFTHLMMQFLFIMVF